MPIRIRLAEGDTLYVDVDLAEWNEAFQTAVAAGTMIEIAGDDGRVLGINPQQVLYLEEAVPAGSAEAPAAAHPTDASTPSASRSRTHQGQAATR